MFFKVTNSNMQNADGLVTLYKKIAVKAGIHAP
jgi:hypothetical protein